MDIKRTKYSFTLEEKTITPAINKVYPFSKDIEELSRFDWVQIAEDNSRIVGIAALSIETWNRRTILHHLYITKEFRGVGIGRILVQAAVDASRCYNARCLWVETQSINYSAILFYKSLGFNWCGLDTSLYDPSFIDSIEIALFFSLVLE